MSDLPYFDLLLKGRREQDPAALVFSRFVHWGYWADPSRATGTAEDYQDAMRRLDDEVVAGARVQDGMSFADVGCGFGGTLKRLSERLPSARLVGVNFDGRQLAVAEKSRSALLRADACRLPLKTAAFDAITAVECIFHFPSRMAFLEEAARALKRGGRLSLSDFVPVFTSGRSSLKDSWLERKIGEGYGRAGAGWEHGSYADMAAKAGLIVESDRDVTRETLPTYPFLLRLIKSKGFGGPEGKMLWPTRLLYWLSASRFLRYRIVSFRKP